MRQSYIRPLSFNYVDANEKSYAIHDIPAKFLEKQDDYQKRKEKTQIIPQPLPQKLEPYSPTAHASYQMNQQPHFPQPQPKLKPISAQESIAQRNLFACCQVGSHQRDLCHRCMGVLCRSCLNNPERIRKCTKCIQKVCRTCKQNLKIVFPDYNLRNYTIKLKNYENLHFQDCQCKVCSQDH